MPTTQELLNAFRPHTAGTLAGARRPQGSLAVPASSVALARAAAASVARHAKSFSTPVVDFHTSKPFDQDGNFSRVRSGSSSTVLARTVVAFQMDKQNSINPFTVDSAAVYADGVKLTHGVDYFTRRRFGAVRVYVYASRLRPSSEVFVELRPAPARPELATFVAGADRAAGRPFEVAFTGRAGLTGGPKEVYAVYMKRATEPFFKLMLPSECPVTEHGLGGLVLAPAAPMLAGDAVCVVNRTSYTSRTVTLPASQPGYSASPLVRLALTQRVSGQDMPMPFAHPMDLTVSLNGLKLTLGLHYTVKTGRTTPMDPPYIQFASELPEGSVLEVETGRAYLPQVSASSVGSDPKGISGLAPALLPIAPQSVEAYSRGRRVPYTDLAPLADSAVALGEAHGPDELEAIYSPLYSGDLASLSAWFTANRAQPDQDAAANYSTWLSAYLSNNPRPDVVDDGVAGPLLGTAVTDELLVAEWLKYGRGGQHPDEPDFVDANDLEDSITFADYSIDANDQDFPDLGLSGQAIDANNTAWATSPRPADPSSVTTTYSSEAYNFGLAANIMETLV
jgi:hypothetical protein